MNELYVYQKPPRNSHYARYRRRLKYVVAALLVIAGAGAFVYANLRGSKNDATATFPVRTSTVSDNEQTFTSPDFSFQDTGKWVLDQKDSTPNKFIYTDYLGQVIEAQLDVYINQEPAPDYVTRVLPVRIANNNGFEITGVSDPCANQYAAGELHRVKEVSIHDAAMFCDPDDPQYSVILSQIGGDYHLKMQRADGTYEQVVIIYRNQDINPRPNNILNIASSFKSL